MNRLTKCVVVFFAFFMGFSVLEVFGGPMNLLARMSVTFLGRTNLMPARVSI